MHYFSECLLSPALQNYTAIIVECSACCIKRDLQFCEVLWHSLVKPTCLQLQPIHRPRQIVATGQVFVILADISLGDGGVGVAE